MSSLGKSQAVLVDSAGHTAGLSSGSAFSAVKGEVRGCRASCWQFRQGPCNPVYTVCSKPVFAQGVGNDLLKDV